MTPSWKEIISKKYNHIVKYLNIFECVVVKEMFLTIVIRNEKITVLWVLICTVHLTVCSCHVTYAFQSESTLYIGLNFKELLARSRREIWSLSDCNWTRTHNHLVHKRALNHLVKLTKWLSCVVRTSYDKNIQLNAPYR